MSSTSNPYGATYYRAMRRDIAILFFLVVVLGVGLAYTFLQLQSLQKQIAAGNGHQLASERCPEQEKSHKGN